MSINFDDFLKVELHSGVIEKVEEFSRARKPAYKIWVNFGKDIGVLGTSAQITVHYSVESLVGKKVIGATNLGEKNIAGFKSQFLLLGFPDENNHIKLASYDEGVPLGARLC